MQATVSLTFNGKVQQQATVTLPSPTGPVAQFGKVDYGNKASTTRGYKVVLAQANTTPAYIQSLRQAGAKVFVYQAMCATPVDPTGIRMMQPWPAPSGTLILDASGQPLYSSSWNIYFLDFSLSNVQALCAQHAIQIAKNLGADGIYIDGVDTQLGLGSLKQQPAPASPVVQSNANYVAGLTSFLKAFCASLHAAGLQVMLNIGGAANSDVQAGLWQQWSAFADGSEDELFGVGWKGAVYSPAQIARQVSNFAWCEAHGKIALANQDSTVQSNNVYGLALMLMAANGLSVWNTSDGLYAGNETWWPEYDTARTLGAPLGPYTLQNGVYSRRFQGGIVTANTSTQTGSI